jgi:hypothetical protein
MSAVASFRQRQCTDWLGFERSRWMSEDTLDPAARLAAQARIAEALAVPPPHVQSRLWRNALARARYERRRRRSFPRRIL